MTSDYVAGTRDSAVVRLGGISPSWLADQLDEQGVVRLRDAFSGEWLEAMRQVVIDGVDHHGDGDLFIARPDQTVGSPAHRLMSDPAFRQLLDETARLRRPKAVPNQAFQCNIPVRNGIAPKIRSNLFHYDPTVLTLVIPLIIPRGAVGNCGEFAAFGNKRPFRRFVATHLVETALTHNWLYRRHLVKKINESPGSYIVDFQPGDAYLFWGYRQFHGNLVCAPGLLRATAVIGFGEVHAGSRMLRAAWRISRSRRDIGRLHSSPPPSIHSRSASIDRSA